MLQGARMCRQLSDISDILILPQRESAMCSVFTLLCTCETRHEDHVAYPSVHA